MSPTLSIVTQTSVHGTIGQVAHSVLVIPVAELNDWVLTRTVFYDASFAPEQPDFINAHITLLGPWLSDPSSADLDLLADIARTTPAFDFTLETIETFPDGLVYLAPKPAAPFAALTERIAQAFPEYLPYGGEFGSVHPHLTLDRLSAEVSVASVRESLGRRIPVTTRATRIDLQWWENDNCHLRQSWELN